MFRDKGGSWSAAIAGAAARLAARRALPGDVAPLWRTLDDMARAESMRAGSRAALRRLDGRFHVEVAAASQSARLTQEEIRFQADIGPLLWLPYDEPGGHDEATAQHRAIAGAIRGG